LPARVRDREAGASAGRRCGPGPPHGGATPAEHRSASRPDDGDDPRRDPRRAETMNRVRGVPDVPRGRSATRRVALLLALGLLIGRAAPADTPSPPGAREFTIARLKYGGGGDWYEDRTSMVNLMAGLKARTSLPIAGDREAVVEPGSAALFQYPFVFACGHGNMKFTPGEVTNVR